MYKYEENSLSVLKYNTQSYFSKNNAPWLFHFYANKCRNFYLII